MGCAIIFWMGASILLALATDGASLGPRGEEPSPEEDLPNTVDADEK